MDSKKRRQRILRYGAALCCCFLGCSQQPSDHAAVHKVNGKVLLDGKPIGGAMVVLHPLEAAASTEVRPLAYTQDDGTFTIATYDAADGAPAGKYTATIEWFQ